MTFTRDYWIQLAVGSDEWNKNLTVDNVTSFSVNDGFVYFYNGLNVIMAIPQSNILFFGSKEHVKK